MKRWKVVWYIFTGISLATLNNSFEKKKKRQQRIIFKKILFEFNKFY